MARKKKQQEGGAGAPLWMATYGDLVTLLLCFFVLLYSFSSLDAAKFEILSASLNQAFNVQPGGRTTDTTPGLTGGSLQPEPGNVSRPTDGQDTHIAREMRTIVEDMDLKDKISVTQTERGVRVSLTEQVLFESGSATLRPVALRILFKIGEALRDIPNQIAVEGHTDNTPLGESIYRNNWDLSAARAASVAFYLEDRLAIPAERLQAVGFSSARPIVPNDTDTHRLLNRRMDLMILSMHNVR